MSLKLYSYFRSSCAFRVRIALNLKGLNYETIPVHLLNDGGEQHKKDYLALNPSAQVPSLTDGEFTLGQSMAILEYLEDTHPEPALLPQDKKERALVRQMCEVVNSGIQPLQNLSVTVQLVKQLQATDEQKKQWLQYWITKGYNSLNTLVEKHGGRYCFGDQITLADCCLAPQMFSSTRFDVDLSPFPKLVKINDLLMKNEKFINASPAEQPDAQ